MTNGENKMQLPRSFFSFSRGSFRSSFLLFFLAFWKLHVLYATINVFPAASSSLHYILSLIFLCPDYHFSSTCLRDFNCALFYALAGQIVMTLKDTLMKKRKTVNKNVLDFINFHDTSLSHLRHFLNL